MARSRCLARAQHLLPDTSLVAATHYTPNIPANSCGRYSADTMTASKRVVNAKSGSFHQRVVKRVALDTDKKQKSKVSVGPVMLGFFLFVVVGSALLQIIRTATTGQLQA